MFEEFLGFLVGLTFFFSEFEIKRKPEHGGDVSYATFEDLKEAFRTEVIYPLDLKNAVATYINQVKPILVFQ